MEKQHTGHTLKQNIINLKKKRKQQKKIADDKYSKTINIQCGKIKDKIYSIRNNNDRGK